jgi:hypothetical protein
MTYGRPRSFPTLESLIAAAVESADGAAKGRGRDARNLPRKRPIDDAWSFAAQSR